MSLSVAEMIRAESFGRGAGAVRMYEIVLRPSGDRLPLPAHLGCQILSFVVQRVWFVQTCTFPVGLCQLGECSG